MRETLLFSADPPTSLLAKVSRVDADFVDTLLAWLVAMPATWAILRWDESRLSEAELENAWPPVSRNAAVLAFGPLCLFVHFFRTRASFLLGLALGAAAFVAVGVLHGVAAYVVELALGLSP